MAAASAYDLVVIGGGPGGYVGGGARGPARPEDGLRREAAAPGRGVPERRLHPEQGAARLERVLPPGARPSFAEPRHRDRRGRASTSPRMMARKEQVVKDLTDNVRKLLESHKVEIVHGHGAARGRGPGRGRAASRRDTLEAKQHHPRDRQRARGAARHRLRRQADRRARPRPSQFDAVPGRLGIVGGGYIGLELGSVWLRLGAQVTVIEMLPDIAASMDGQVGRRLLRVLKKQGFDFRLETRVTARHGRGRQGQPSRSRPTARPRPCEFDRLLVSVGRRPLTAGAGPGGGRASTPTRQTGFVRVDASLRTSVPASTPSATSCPAPCWPTRPRPRASPRPRSSPASPAR
ncbi:MAG: FAD-dependent oxidoreductase [Desulfobacterales bacterium]|nr:FAD-dependent oxidoreductase [Desulfobacterales bacterium]